MNLLEPTETNESNPMHPNLTNPNAATRTNEYKLANPNETNKSKLLLTKNFFDFLKS